MLYNGSDVIRDVEWVIFDEVHYINDSEVSSCTVTVKVGIGFAVTLVFLCTSYYIIFMALLVAIEIVRVGSN